MPQALYGSATLIAFDRNSPRASVALDRNAPRASAELAGAAGASESTIIVWDTASGQTNEEVIRRRGRWMR